jgi:hypothetical protein
VHPIPPPPPPSGTTGLFALLFSIFVLLVMPLVFIVTPVFAGGRQYTTVLTVLAPIGGLVWFAALGLSIHALVKAKRTQSPTALGWLSIAFTILALGTGALGWVLGFIITAGGGPH